MIIDLNKYKDELFNPLIYDLQKSNKRFVISYGSAGSGKSVTQTQHEIIKCLSNKEKLLVTRKVGSTLNDSVISLFMTILSQWGLSEFINENKSRQFIDFANGSQVLFKGMDDAEKIKSIAGLTRIWNEEATELTMADFKQLNLRLRGRDNLQMTSTFNPIDENHWIKSHFIDNPTIRDKTDIFKTTYKDNKFIDEAYKQELESYALIDPNYYRIYALGEWGGLTEGRIFSNWEEIDELPNIAGQWYGLDFGYTNDPTGIVKTVKMMGCLYFDEVCYRKGLTNSDIAAVLRDDGYSGELVICDSAEPKSIEELRRLGINAIPANKGQGSVNAGIDFLRRSKIFITKRSENIRKENRYYQWQQTKSGLFINTPKDFLNHLIDPMRYAYSYQMPDNGIKPRSIAFQVKN
jgi:phage terminase large subunit